MALTLAEADAHIIHAIGGKLVGIDQRRVLDEAGRKLLTLRRWQWARRPSTTLDLTASQAYITLPTDFGTIVSLEYTATSWNRIQTVTLPDIARMRTQSIGGYGDLYVAPTYSISADGIPSPRLEVYPTPSATSAGALTLHYEIRWVDLSVAGENYIPVPEWLESLYIQLVRAIAWGYQNDDMTTRLAIVLASPDYFAAVAHDSRLQPVYGPLLGGMTSGDYPYDNYLRQVPANP